MQAIELFKGAAGRELVTKSGKTAGARYTFMGSMTAGEVRQAGKGLGLKGAKLTEYVNKSLTDSAAGAQAKVAAAVSALQSGGYVPDYTDVRAKSALIRFVKPAEPKVKVEPTEAELAEKLFGCSVEELRAAISLVKK